MPSATDLQLRDVVAAIGSSTDSDMNRMRFDGLIDYAPVADFGLLRTSVEVAERRGIAMHVGPILAADAFYTDRPDLYDTLADYGVLAVEMESAALYTIAARFKARALTVLTVSDHIKTGEKTTSQEREQTFSQMVEIALDTDHRLTVRTGGSPPRADDVDKMPQIIPSASPLNPHRPGAHGPQSTAASASVGERRAARTPGRGRRRRR